MEAKPRILIVDDTTTDRQINAMVLSKEGYVLEFACDGEDCLRKLDSFKPDVILSDIVMPGMGGFEMCRAIKANPNHRHVPVILLSALDGTKDIIRGLDEGADEFLPKPANPSELQARVRSMLRIKKQHDALQETLKRRDEIAHMIVHDMRTPLNVITGMAEMLAIDGIGKEKTGQAVERIMRQARRLNSLTTDLLITSKIEHGRMLLNRKPFSLVELISKSLENYEALAEATSHRLVFEYPREPLPNLDGDYPIILRVFDNLISNALKYSPSNTEISITVEHDEESGRIAVRVADQGSGIPVEQGEVIFEKYGTLKNAPEGVRQFGLGLYFCKLAVEAHGGGIEVEPNEPYGSVFCVTLPVAVPVLAAGK